MVRGRRIPADMIPDPPDRDDPPRDELMELLQRDADDSRPLARCGLKLVETLVKNGDAVVVHLLHIPTATHIRIDGQAWLILRPMLMNFTASVAAEDAATRLAEWVDAALPAPVERAQTPSWMGDAEPREPVRDALPYAITVEQRRELRGLVSAMRYAVRPS